MKRLLAGLSALVLSLAGLLTSAGMANAAASDESCALFNHVGEIDIVPIYQGDLCAKVHRNGNRLSHVEYRINQTTPAGSICDWWVDFDYWSKGERYFHNQGQEQNACVKYKPLVSNDAHGTRRNASDMPSELRPGWVCATLFHRPGGSAEVTEIIDTCVRV